MTALLLIIACAPTEGGADRKPDSGTASPAWTAPENRWPSAVPPSDLEAEGLGEGEVAPDFLMMDQHGEPVALWQFYGQVIVLDVSPVWCLPCQVLAAEVDAITAVYAPGELAYLTLIVEDLGGGLPSLEVLQAWASDFGVSSPVLADTDGYGFEVAFDGSYPTVMVIDPRMRVSSPRVRPADADNIHTAIDNAIDNAIDASH
jgi:hypothetical protein